jgi:hypothetical protein
MPTFTLVSAWRKVELTEKIKRPLGGSISRTTVGLGTGGGTSLGALAKTHSPVPDSFPRNFSFAANDTWTQGLPFIPQPLEPLEAHDLSIPLYASRTDHMHGDGGFINVTLNTNNVNLNSEESRNITRSVVVLERTFRVKSSREMKTPWSIPYTRRASYFSKRGEPWSAPAPTTGTFTFATGQIYSDAVILNMASMGGSINPELPGQIRANGNWFETLTTEAETVEWLTVDQFSTSSTNLAYDNDQDGVSNELELKMGTDPTQRNSDGSGYADGDQLNQGVLPPPDGLVMTTRQSEYQYSPEDLLCPGHPANRLAVETDIPVVNYVNDPNGAKLGVDDVLQSALANHGPFPLSAPTGSPMPLPEADASATASKPVSEMAYTKSSNGTIETAAGKQRRVWGYTAELPTANFSRAYLKIRTEQQDSAAATIKTEVINLNFTPASKTSTNYVDLVAKRPAASGQNTKVTEDLILVDFKTFPDSEPGPDKAHKKNLNTRQNETAAHGAGWEKVVCKVWNASPGKVNLIDYLDGGPENRSLYQDAVKWRVDGTEQAAHELLLGDKPDSEEHTRFKVQVVSKNGGVALDSLIITVVPPETKANFDAWYAAESTVAGKAWLAELPRMPTALEIVQDDFFNIYALPPDNQFPTRMWNEASSINTRFHPDGYWEIRAKKTPGGHGHQACFERADPDRQNSDTIALIDTGVSAGTADKEAAWPEQWPTFHIDADVTPFMWALQLDGNPCDQSTTTLTMPMLHEGAFIKKYMECRPPVPNAKPRFVPGGAP